MTPDPSSALPRRASRSAEAAEHLRQLILAGTWLGLLPGEMDLARQLQVGRNTVRSALSQLEDEGLLKNRMGRRREVVTASHLPVPKVSNKAVLLLAVPYHALAPSTLLWMEALRLDLQGAGWLLQIQTEPAAFRRNSAAVLSSLTAASPGTVWILHRSTAAMQQWFQQQALPAVIAGTQHAEITLPRVDTDYRATSRHAAARLTSRGHRHLAVLTSKEGLAGDVESLAGFREGSSGNEVAVITHNNTPAGVIAALRPVFEGSRHPTALFVLRAEHFATALTWLLEKGVSIPAQVSLVCRDDEPFLQHLHPEPTRYRRSAENFAKKLSRLVTSCSTDRRAGKLPGTLLMPEFLPGGTLGPAHKSH